MWRVTISFVSLGNKIRICFHVPKVVNGASDVTPCQSLVKVHDLRVIGQQMTEPGNIMHLQSNIKIYKFLTATKSTAKIIFF